MTQQFGVWRTPLSPIQDRLGLAVIRGDIVWPGVCRSGRRWSRRVTLEIEPHLPSELESYVSTPPVGKCPLKARNGRPNRWAASGCAGTGTGTSTGTGTGTGTGLCSLGSHGFC